MNHKTPEENRPQHEEWPGDARKAIVQGPLIWLGIIALASLLIYVPSTRILISIIALIIIGGWCVLQLVADFFNHYDEERKRSVPVWVTGLVLGSFVGFIMWMQRIHELKTATTLALGVGAVVLILLCLYVHRRWINKHAEREQPRAENSAR